MDGVQRGRDGGQHLEVHGVLFPERLCDVEHVSEHALSSLDAFVEPVQGQRSLARMRPIRLCPS